jgi:acyl-CoA synthetase (AMP-forming)/AMP-acid ligase II
LSTRQAGEHRAAAPSRSGSRGARARALASVRPYWPALVPSGLVERPVVISEETIVRQGQALAGAFDEDGYFRMGDLGRRVHGRYLVITGRKKDIIIRSGENLSPKEVEDILATHPAVADIAIVAMPSRETGEKGCAFVVLRPGQIIDLGEIRRFLERARLARQKFPEHLVIVDELPRVPSGKVSKDVLRARAKAIAEGGEAAPCLDGAR